MSFEGAFTHVVVFGPDQGGKNITLLPFSCAVVFDNEPRAVNTDRFNRLTTCVTLVTK